MEPTDALRITSHSIAVCDLKRFSGRYRSSRLAHQLMCRRFVKRLMRLKKAKLVSVCERTEQRLGGVMCLIAIPYTPDQARAGCGTQLGVRDF